MKLILIVIIVIMSSLSVNAQKILFINEIMAKNDSFMKDDKGKFSDWIEIYNSSSSEVDLSAYYLTDDKDTLNKWKIPVGVKIPAKGYLIFWADGEPANGSRHTNFKLGADGETLCLVLPDGKSKVDTVKYPLQESNISFGRVEDGSSNWIFFEQPTFASTNHKGSTSTLPVVVNEIMASNSKTLKDETGAYPDWIELYNNSDNEIDISGFYLTDEPKGYPSQWRIPAGTRITARGFLILYADGDAKDGPYHTNFKLDKDGDSVAIYSSDGSTIVDMMIYNSQQTDVSYGRKRDAETEWVFFNLPTPGKSNNTSGVNDLTINDFTLYNNYPNPFSQTTNLSFSLPDPGIISIEIFNVEGKQVRENVSMELNSGSHNIILHKGILNSGIYYYRIYYKGASKTGKMIID